MTYYANLEDLLVDLEVLTNLEDRLESDPELIAKIEEIARPAELEATIKAIAVVIREHIGFQ